MWIGPPKALDCPKPMSSISTISTLGALAGAFTSNRGGALALRASTWVMGGYRGSGIGRTDRSRPARAARSPDAAFSWVVGAPGVVPDTAVAAQQPSKEPSPIQTGAQSFSARIIEIIPRH